MNYREHKHKVLSKLCYFTGIDEDEIICPESNDPFFQRSNCRNCNKKFNCEAWNEEKYDKV